jgi:serine/threonine-protein kinase
MLVPDPAMPTGERLKVLDFGLAKLATVRQAKVVQTQSQMIFGTPLYMSPEQCEGAGQVDAKTDVYALGCILYELLSGQPPFVGEGTGQVIGQHLFKQPEPLTARVPRLPEELSRLVGRLLIKEKDARPSMRETLEALEALAPTLPPPRRRQLADPSGALSSEGLAAVGTAETLASVDTGTPSALGLATTQGQGSPPPSEPTRLDSVGQSVGPLAPGTLPELGPGFAAQVALGRGESGRGGNGSLGQGSAQSVAASRGPRPVARLAALGGGLILLLALALGIVGLSRSPQAVPPADLAPAAPAQVTAQISSQPPGAQVLDGSGKALGTTPWQRQAPPQAGTQALTLRLDGHDDQAVTVDLSRDHSQTVQLSPSPPPPSAAHKKAAGGKKPALKRLAAPIKKLANRIADKLKRKPAAKSGKSGKSGKPSKPPRSF